MLRSSLVAASAVILCSAASAQQQVTAKKVLGPVKNAGTYHVATQTWTRGGEQTNISPDRIYRNDVGSGYFGVGWEGCWSIDEVVLPGPNNPAGGTLDCYTVDGFDFSYCKLGTGTVDWYFGYYGSYVPCDDPSSPAGCIDEKSTGFLIPGLPGGSACWILTIDLAGGYEVGMDADGGSCAPDYQGGGLGLDHGGLGFGWSTSDGGTTGPFLNGDPTWTPAGDGTCYTPTFNNACGAAAATGLGAQDLFSISNYDFGGSGQFANCGIGNGCYFFGGYANNNGCGAASNVPIGHFGFSLYSDCATPGDCDTGGGGSITIYCDENDNPNNVADIAIDTFDSGSASINVSMTNAPANQFVYLLVGNGNSQVANPPGAKGNLCVVGGDCLGRYDKDVGQVSTAGTFSTDIANAISNPCAGAVNIDPGASWNFQYWHRQPMGQPATFSNAGTVVFE